MGSHAALCGKNTLGCVHALDVLGACLATHEDDVLAICGPCFGVVSREDDETCGGTGARGKTLRDDVTIRCGIEPGVEELVKVKGIGKGTLKRLTGKMVRQSP
jgi:hypothetical protein